MSAIGRSLVGLLAVAGLAQASELSEGVKAPAFEGQDQHGHRVRLADYLGKANVVLYFYPKDDTPGCTAEACSLRDGFAAIQATGAALVGVSADDARSHQAFTAKYSLPFSLLPDPQRTIIEAYGVKMPVVGIAKRVTFIIDKQGVIRHIFRDVDTRHHDQQILAILKSLS